MLEGEELKEARDLCNTQENDIISHLHTIGRQAKTGSARLGHPNSHFDNPI